MLPHPVQFTNDEIFSNAARSDSFCLVSVPRLSESRSQPKEVASFEMHFLRKRFRLIEVFHCPFPTRLVPSSII